jgi:cbb3-type cytochrome oxidase subunit 3
MDFISSNAGLIGLIFFFIFFCLVALWTFRPRSKKKYEEHAKIPLEEKD